MPTEPPLRSRWIVRRRWIAVLLAAIVAGVAIWATVVEPNFRLVVERVDFASGPGWRVAHLSDLHVDGSDEPWNRMVEEVSALAPAAILVSGDFISLPRDPRDLDRRLGATLEIVRRLVAIAPVYAVQGHSDYDARVVVALAEAGVTWLSNEGRIVGPAGGLLLLGLNEQVGRDRREEASEESRRRFRPMLADGEPAIGERWTGGQENLYLSWDPDPPTLAATDGPLSWGGYEAACSLRISDEDTAAGLAVHSRYPLGEDRLLRLARAGGEPYEPGAFAITFNGSLPTAGQLDTGVVPEPDRWYRLRIRTEVEPATVRILAKVWPEEAPEPAEWQAWAEDSSSRRIEAGTVGLWAWGEGSVFYRDLVVSAGDERLLAADLRKGSIPDGFRHGARAPRLDLALARSPGMEPGRPTVVLSHVPDVALDAIERGVDVVLAGHTHGGQVRIPGFGALVTRSALPRRYDRGRFRFAGAIDLYVNAGVGTSLLPIRFADPPTVALIDLPVGEKPGAPIAE